MKNYKAMKVDELRQEVLGTGTNPLGWTKAQMVRWMESHEMTKNMSIEELRELIRRQRGN